METISLTVANIEAQIEFCRGAFVHILAILEMVWTYINVMQMQWAPPILYRLADLVFQRAARSVALLGLDGVVYRRALRSPLVANAADGKVHLHFVCQGNILRSAYAAERCLTLLQQRSLSGYQVSSSGTATKDGKPADPRGRKIAKDRGVSLDEHKTRPVDASMVENASLIIAMDRQIKGDIWQRFPQVRSKVLLLGAMLLPEGEGPYIHDPFTKDERFIETTFSLIDRAVQKLVDNLPARNAPFEDPAPVNGRMVPGN